MHALEQIERVLRPEGVLYDVRPVAEEWPVEVLVAGDSKVAGYIDSSAKAMDDIAADRALEDVVKRNIFRLEESDSFNYEYLWETPQQMADYFHENWSANATLPGAVVAEAERLAGHEAFDGKIRVRRKMIIGLYSGRTE